MGSVLDTDQKPAETCAKTVKTTATRCFNFSSIGSPLVKSTPIASNLELVLVPLQMRTGLSNLLLSSTTSSDSSETSPTFIFHPPTCNLIQASPKLTDQRIPLRVIQPTDERKSYSMGMCCERKTLIGWRNVWSCYSQYQESQKVEGAKPRGRSKKTWREIEEKDCQAYGLSREDALHRTRWMKQIWGDWWPW